MSVRISTFRLNLQDWNACAKNTTEYEIQEGGRVILSSLSRRVFRRNEIRPFPERARYKDSYQDKFQWKKLPDSWKISFGRDIGRRREHERRFAGTET